MTQERWPALSYDAWSDTYATLHMWTQVVGKVALAQAPRVNHSWGSALTVTARGLRTHLLPHGTRSFTVEFDFIAHELAIESADGARSTLPLAPRSVADFYADVMGTLDAMGLPVKIWTTPVEIPLPIPFEKDTEHHSYDPEFANRFWRILVEAHRVLSACRCGFIGKCSPVHFFWGSFDLAVTRFSGRSAPPRDGPEFMREAYSHEVVSHGFWPGSGQALYPAFYAYAAPEPNGFKTASVRPAEAFYQHDMGEFVLPYDAVRAAPSPDAAITAFVASTYDAAATLAGWDRAALEEK